jgi:glycosyltransferase involved in cell wall biosynthesis
MVIMHGKITMSHGTAEVMKAVAILRHEHHIPCRIIMLKERAEMPGFADTPVGKLAQELGISECLDLRDPVPFKAMFPLMQTCDVGVIAYQRTFGRKCMPNRVFEYMAVGLPVIVPSYAEEMQRIVPKYECGIMCDTENPQELSNALRGLWMNKTEAKRMGSNGRKAFEAGLNWEEESRPLMEWIRNNAAR